MAAKKATTKKDLESKIAELEAKLTKLSSQLQTPPTPKPAQTSPPPKPAETKPAQTQTPPPKPQPAASSPRGSLPKGMGQKPAEAPKPAEKAGAPGNVAQALEHAYQNARMTNTHDYKTKVPGFTPAPNRYFVRKTAPRGTVPTQSWNLQKSKVPGYTQPSNQYFATRARLAYHPPEKTFTGYGMKVEGVPEAKTQTQTAPPPPPKPSTTRGSLPKGMGQPQAQVQQQTSSSSGSGKTKQEQLADYEAEYLARMERERKEAEELQRAAAELAAKRRAEGQSSSSPGKSRGTLPKGF